MRNKFTATCFKCGRPVHAGTGETNMIGGKWATRHLTEEACKQAVPKQAHTHSYTYRDPFYDDYDDWAWGGTSEDVNPNEGSK